MWIKDDVDESGLGSDDVALQSENSSVLWSSLGLMAYDEALAIQESQANRLLELQEETQVVYTVEHPPTITIGKNGTKANIVASDTWLEQMGFAVRNVDRGGDVTYHGPGQAVLYPVLHLNPWGNDVGKYVRNLEECVILALREAGIEGERLEGYPGVWVNDEKVCAIGARVKRRVTGEFVTSHGLALNVTTNLAHFQTIIPCGIQDKGVTSVANLLGEPPAMEDWFLRLKKSFETVFEVELT